MMAGGTGGHVYPALAVATELRERGFDVEWVGTRRGLEARVVPAAGILLHTLAVRGVRGKNLIDTLLGILLLLWSLLQAFYLVLRRSPSCVIGMGGYVAGPAGIAAWLLRKPLLIHEQNAVAGTTNRLLAARAKKVLCGFPDAFAKDIAVSVVGNPVRREIIDAARDNPWNYQSGAPLRVLVVGGSLGARPLNELVPGAVAAVRADAQGIPVEVWHQTGEAHLQGVRDSYGVLLDDAVKVTAFIDDMAAAYSWADLVICRAGALTVSELAIMGRPAFLIPLPYAIDDHQTANAKSLTERGGGRLFRQSELDQPRLVAALKEMVSSPETLRDMAAAAALTALPHATAAVCDDCEALIHHE
jgi:UDP-N-acetylglucosamine--N-acetylmuramyl-(pentapeptide) pyrophosphoryl-undecaprenol N-acetylglucosamine transferase